MYSESSAPAIVPSAHCLLLSPSFADLFMFATRSLSYNNIGADGAKALAQALQTNSTLATLR